MKLTLGATFVPFAALLIAAVSAATLTAQAPPPAGFPGQAPEGPPPQIETFTASEPNIQPGESVTLRWAALNTYSLSIEPGIGTVATRGTREVQPAATTTYTLSVTGTGGTLTRSLTVNVSGTQPVNSSTAAGTAERPIPRMPDGTTPDLSGVFMGGRNIRVTTQPRLTGDGESFRVVQRDDDLGQGAECLPPGVPAATAVPYPLQIVQRPEVVVIIYEAYNLFRIIPIGSGPIGSGHPDDLYPTWMGHSAAHWDGDTLVVDVVAFNDKTNVGGFRHTEDLHVVERYRRTAFDTIEYEAIVEDPNVFASPLIYSGNFEFHPEWEIGEYVCAENNKDYEELYNPN